MYESLLGYYSNEIDEAFTPVSHNVRQIVYPKHVKHTKFNVRHRHFYTSHFWTDGENLYLANQDGISVINLNGELINSIREKLTDFLKFFKSNNQYYFVDSRNLYTLSE